jgi:hypothetical protein
VTDRAAIAANYARGGRLWLDLATTIPFDWVVLLATGLNKSASVRARYISLLRLLRLGRVYRLEKVPGRGRRGGVRGAGRPPSCVQGAGATRLWCCWQLNNSSVGPARGGGAAPASTLVLPSHSRPSHSRPSPTPPTPGQWIRYLTVNSTYLSLFWATLLRNALVLFYTTHMGAW